ncbi:hypothetical protein GLOIN_2v1472483 [Rhizophagus irregularis DAOM 181602=DAOM 197198]|nr:hypothetical protein GLOIN_2v1472483 [Rhizophagus irregularis DAOM 181602=DAOM 197198]
MVENQKALFHVMLMPSRWLHNDTWKNIDSIYCEPFINTLSQNFSNTNNKQIFNPRHYNNIQGVQVYQQVRKKMYYGRIMGHFKKNDLILSYIAKRVEEREARYQSTTTNKIQPSNNTIKSKDGCVYNVTMSVILKIQLCVRSTSTSEQINIGCEENEINGRRCRLCHKTGHYVLKCPNKKNTNVNG